jgi:hypothetical protein
MERILGKKKRIFSFLLVFWQLSFLYGYVAIEKQSNYKTVLGKKKVKKQVQKTGRKKKNTKGSCSSSNVSSSKINSQKRFSEFHAKFFDTIPYEKKEVVWEEPQTSPFDELIVSWNAKRPDTGKILICVSVFHQQGNKWKWSTWHKLAAWGPDSQRSFFDKRNYFVHTNYTRVEVKHKAKACGFRIKAIFCDGANPGSLKAFFANHANLSKARASNSYFNKPTVLIKGVPCQSQMVLDHPRFTDLCSPTSLSIVVNYFRRILYGEMALPMEDFVVDFAEKVRDQGNLDIYGNWILNVPQAYDATHGGVFYTVQRLNGFSDLYDLLKQKIPVVVSVRRLRGGATPYAHGHLLVVVGWNNARQRVLCVDPAFKGSKNTQKAYPLKSFIQAWGSSTNLSYVPIIKEELI